MLGAPIEFGLFAMTLVGVALFHHHTLYVALTGLAVVTLYKLVFTGFKTGAGLEGSSVHIEHEWVILTNLFGLLPWASRCCRKHFEESRIPAEMPHFLPDDWKGGFALLVIVFVLSAFLDNIAAALIGGTMATEVFRGKVHIGYLAGIVAASNAGGSGSVVGDTTTTMMWIDGVSPLNVSHAYVAAVRRARRLGIPAAMQQQRLLADRAANATAGARSTGRASPSSCIILVAAITANVVANIRFPDLLDHFPLHRCRGVGRDLLAAPLAQTRLVTAARKRSRARSSCCRS